MINHQHEATALIAIDQSTFYDVIKHETLLSKMRHLNFKDKTLSVTENLLKNRKSFVEINSTRSRIQTHDPWSVLQGSSLSGTFANIYCLNLHLITHNEKHTTHSSYKNCSEQNELCSYASTYIDDAYFVIKGSKANIKQRIISTISNLK